MPFRDRPGAFAGKYKQDPREFDPRRCYRLHMDACDGTSFSPASGTMRHTNFFRGVNGTITHVMDYGDKVANYYRLTTAASAPGSRSWLTDRVGNNQPALTAGLAEMDFQAMVRIPSEHVGTGASVGFVAAHSDPGPLVYNQIAFEYYRTGVKESNNWHACITVNNASTGTPIFSRIDTGVSALDWNILRVWVNKEANRAVWSINDVVVREETNPSLFPTWNNMVSLGEVQPNIVLAAVGMQACCRVRTDVSATNDAGSLDCNWMLYRYFREYA